MVVQSTNDGDDEDEPVELLDDVDERVDREHMLDMDESHQLDNGYPSEVDNNLVASGRDHWLVLVEYDEDREHLFEPVESVDEQDQHSVDNNALKPVYYLVNLLLEMMMERSDLWVLIGTEVFHFQISLVQGVLLDFLR